MKPSKNSPALFVWLSKYEANTTHAFFIILALLLLPFRTCLAARLIGTTTFVASLLVEALDCETRVIRSDLRAPCFPFVVAFLDDSLSRPRTICVSQ